MNLVIPIANNNNNIKIENAIDKLEVSNVWDFDHGTQIGIMEDINHVTMSSFPMNIPMS